MFSMITFSELIVHIMGVDICMLIGGSPTSSIKEKRDVVNGCNAIQPIGCMENVISKAKMIANKIV